MYLLIFMVCLFGVAASFYYFILSLLQLAPFFVSIPLLFSAVFLAVLCHNYRSKIRSLHNRLFLKKS